MTTELLLIWTAQTTYKCW